MRRASPLAVLIVAVAVAVALVLPSTASAGGTAEAFVKSRQAELSVLLKKGKAASNDQKIEAVFDGMLDYEALARLSLGKYWDERTADERKEFQSVLKQLVQRAYRKNLDKTVDYDIRFRGEAKGDKGFLVRTVAQSKTNAREEPIDIDYVVRQVSGKWRVQDIVTEGSSLVTNYKRQFSRIIKKKGFDELLKRMKRKLDA